MIFYVISHNYSISQRRYDQAIQAINKKNSLGKEYLSNESMTLEGRIKKQLEFGVVPESKTSKRLM